MSYLHSLHSLVDIIQIRFYTTQDFQKYSSAQLYRSKICINYTMQLETQEMGIINAHRDHGLSYRKIWKQIWRYRTTVFKYLRHEMNSILCKSNGITNSLSFSLLTKKELCVRLCQASDTFCYQEDTSSFCYCAYRSKRAPRHQELEVREAWIRILSHCWAPVPQADLDVWKSVLNNISVKTERFSRRKKV